MTMPEAAVDENDRVVLLQHYVRTARQVFPVQGIAKTAGMQKLAHDHLWTRVNAPDARHAVVPLFFCHLVCHSLAISDLSPGDDIASRRLQRHVS